MSVYHFRTRALIMFIFMEALSIFITRVLWSPVSRILRPGGRLVLSTPNILEYRVEIPVFVRRSFDFFREPTLDYRMFSQRITEYAPILPWRLQEWNIFLYQKGLGVRGIFTDKKKMNFLTVNAYRNKPVMFLQARVKEIRTRSKGAWIFRGWIKYCFPLNASRAASHCDGRRKFETLMSFFK